MSFDGLENKLEQAREGTSNGGGQYESYPRVKVQPTAAIGGTLVDVGFTGDPYEEQNIRGGEGYGGDFVFTLEDPTVVRGQLWEALGRTSADDNRITELDPSYYPFDVDRYNGKPTRDFRLVDSAGPDAQHIKKMAKEVDGDFEQVGIEVFGTEFPAKPTTFDDTLEQHDRVEVFVSGQGGRMAMQAVDCTLGQSAYIRDDGQKTRGLIEFPRAYGSSEWSPQDGDPYPRVARTSGPQIHPSVNERVLAALEEAGFQLRSGTTPR